MEKSDGNGSWNELTTILSLETWDASTVRDILKHHEKEKSTEYAHLLRSFQDRVDNQNSMGECRQDDPLVLVLSKLGPVSSSLTDEHAPLVNLILRCDWCHGPVEVFDTYVTFVSSLLASQPTYADSCLRNIIWRFRTVPLDMKPDLNSNSFRFIDDKLKAYCERIHAVLARVVHIVPLSLRKLLKFIGEGFPFKLRPEEEHFFFTYNILLLHRRRLLNRSEIFTLLIEHIVKIDTEASLKELNEIDVDDESDADEDDEEGPDAVHGEKVMPPASWKIDHPIGERLDLILTLVFECIEEISRHPEDQSAQLRNLYQESLHAFESVIFKNRGLTHVQFIWFYMASLSEKIADDFLQLLLRKILNPSVAVIFRQYAICYASSYLARANFVSIRIVAKFVDRMVQWIHDYIDEEDSKSGVLKDREKIHRVFYAVCQNIFYLLTFRHREILGQKLGLQWFKRLNMERIISCRLNPFRYTQKIVVELFAAVTQEFNLLFCYTVIERNNRLAIMSGKKDEAVEIQEANPLNTFFPFEPYVLKRSKRFIQPIYRTYGQPVTKESGGESEAYQGLIAADSEESEESRDSDIVEERLETNNVVFPRKSRKRQLSENHV